MGWSYRTKSGVLEVSEAFNGYYVEHLPSGETRGIGDGVDMFVPDYGEALSPGTDEFHAALAADVEAAESHYLEAYFREETENAA